MKRSLSFAITRIGRELALILLTLILASLPFTVAQIQITAQLASASLT